MSRATAKTSIFTSFLLHLHPRTVPESTVRFGLSFGLGGMALTLVAVLFLSGLLQLLSYSPHPATAYASIQRLYVEGQLGGFVRNLHYWAGNLLVVVTFFHLIRVYCTGALDAKRRANWLIGLCLFLLVLFSNFTGYLLPWDQLAFWAVTIFTNMLAYIPIVGEGLALLFRGGIEVGQSTLHIFFGLHIGLLPLSIAVLLIVHFWLVRKAGGLIKQEDAGKEKIPVVPNLIARELATACVLLALLGLFAALVDAPLAGPANPGASPNPAKAAWYFMGLQELLLHLHPTFAICVVPLLMLISLAAIPYCKDTVLPGGVWFGGGKGGKIVPTLLLLVSLVTVGIVVWDEQLLHGQAQNLGYDLFTLRGVIPLTLLILMELLLYLLLTRKNGYSKARAIMVLFMANISIVLTLTAIGVWFRGPEMALVVPF